jgi:hypothetical protein
VLQYAYAVGTWFDKHPHQEISKQDSFDLPALGVLQRQFNSNRIAMEFQPFPDTDYRYIN